MWAGCLTFAALFLALGGSFDSDTPAVTAVSNSSPEAPSAPLQMVAASAQARRAEADQAEDFSTLQYEEALGAKLEESIKRADYALIRGMFKLGFKPDRIDISDVEARTSDGREYYFQRIYLDTDDVPHSFITALELALDDFNVRGSVELVEPDVYHIVIDGILTHELIFDRIMPVPESKAKPSDPVDRTGPAPAQKSVGRVVIIIDDLGEDLKFARQLADLDFPVTFAVWPRSTYADETVEIARQDACEVIIHQPMEPLGWPDTSPGPGSVYSFMTAEEIEKVINENIDLVPGAVGMNNHMGSRFTQNGPAVAAVINVLKSRGMFILDSLTHPGSVIPQQARAQQVPVLRRDIFLDVVRDPSAVVHQLQKAERIALKTGQAVAIGHPHPETIQGLRTWADMRNQAVAVATLGEMNAGNSEATTTSAVQVQE